MLVLTIVIEQERHTHTTSHLFGGVNKSSDIELLIYINLFSVSYGALMSWRE